MTTICLGESETVGIEKPAGLALDGEGAADHQARQRSAAVAAGWARQLRGDLT
jgi:hypothetical protein